jgi:hypothetical protein
MRATCHKLTEAEEESLIKWILDLEKRGLPPRPAYVEAMANHLLSQHRSHPPQVGKDWVYNLVKRSSELKTKFLRRYNYERAKCEDSKLIREWFNNLFEKILEFGILDDDIYNFDETGFAMGLCATTRVITSREAHGRPKLLQPGNRE